MEVRKDRFQVTDLQTFRNELNYTKINTYERDT